MVPRIDAAGAEIGQFLDCLRFRLPVSRKETIGTLIMYSDCRFSCRDLHAIIEGYFALKVRLRTIRRPDNQLRRPKESARLNSKFIGKLQRREFCKLCDLRDEVITVLGWNCQF